MYGKHGAIRIRYEKLFPEELRYLCRGSEHGIGYNPEFDDPLPPCKEKHNADHRQNPQ